MRALTLKRAILVNAGFWFERKQVTTDDSMNVSNVSDDVIQTVCFDDRLLVVVVCLRVNRNLSDAVPDVAEFICFSDIYWVLPLMVRDCDCSYKIAKLPIRGGVLCDVFNKVMLLHYRSSLLLSLPPS